MRKVLISWGFSAILVMLVLPWLAANFVNANEGMAVLFILFFIVNPIYVIAAGAFAGKNIKSFWYLPVITSVLFLIGISVMYQAFDSAFIMYAVVYLCLGMISAMISRLLRKKSRK